MASPLEISFHAGMTLLLPLFVVISCDLRGATRARILFVVTAKLKPHGRMRHTPGRHADLHLCSLVKTNGIVVYGGTSNDQIIGFDDCVRFSLLDKNIP